MDSCPLDAVSARIQCLDTCLPRFSDTTPHTRRRQGQHHHGQLNTSSNQISSSHDVANQRVTASTSATGSANITINNAENSTSATTTMKAERITATYAPLTMEKQFQDLYRLLRPALVVADDNKVSRLSTHDDPLNGQKPPQQRNSQRNVSAFIQGPRGSGKTLLLNRVLCALEDEMLQHNDQEDMDKSDQVAKLSSADTVDNAATAAAAVDGAETSTETTSASTRRHKRQLFRIVHINGLVVPGHSVSTIVREILQQLSDAAHYETNARKRARREQQQHRRTNPLDPQADEKDSTKATEDKPNHDDMDHHDYLGTLLRLKQTSFTNQLQLLSEIIQLASVDGIPILFVLDELEMFLSSGGQLLLYHLLDRIAGSSSSTHVLCSLVGLTCDSSILSRLDKRIKSRAEGTAKFILTGRSPSFADVGRILCSKLAIATMTSDSDSTTGVDILGTSVATRNDCTDPFAVVEPDASTSMLQSSSQQLQHEVSLYFETARTGQSRDETTPSGRQYHKVQQALLRDYRTGKNVRWFGRVFYQALARYRGDLERRQLQKPTSSPSNPVVDEGKVAAISTTTTRPFPTFHPKYLEEALRDMGGSIGHDDSVHHPVDATNNSHNQGSGQANTQAKPDVDHFVQALCDLSGPSVALVLAARRILARDNSRTITTTTTNGRSSNEVAAQAAHLPQLTLGRMLHEYQSTYRGSTAVYSTRLLRHAFGELLDVGLLRSAADQCSGGGPYEYQFRHYNDPDDNHMDAVERMPLQLTVDIYRVLKPALEKNLLHCSSALKEWGRKLY